MSIVMESRSVETQSNADAEVSGRFLQEFPQAIIRTCGSFESASEQFIVGCGIDGFQTDSWYAQRTVVELCNQLESQVGSQMMERIGRYVPELTEWPAHSETVKARLAASTNWYDGMHRHHGGSIRFESTGPNQGTLIVDTPYANAFEYGLARGIGHHSLTDSASLRQCTRSDLTDICSRYDVAWIENPRT